MCFLGKEYSCAAAAEAAVVILPVPCEFSTSYGKGTAGGPAAIIKASPQLEYYDEVLDCEPWKVGIYTAPQPRLSGGPRQMMTAIQQEVQKYRQLGKFVISIGGEHSIAAAAYGAHHGETEKISVLQLDAHTDLRATYEGSVFSHACVLRRIWEKNSNIVAAGIRSLSAEEREFIIENSIPVFYAHAFSAEKSVDRILGSLKDKVYITLDVDVLDPSVMPATGTPEPGGLQWYQLMSILYAVFKNKTVIGMDIVEFSPLNGLIHADFTAAKLVYKAVGFFAMGANC